MPSETIEKHEEQETERQEKINGICAKKRVIIFSLLSLFAVGLFAAAIIISEMGLTENQLRGISGEYKKALAFCGEV